MANPQNWCGMVDTFVDSLNTDLQRLDRQLRGSTFHGLSYTEFLEAFEAWTDDPRPVRLVLMFVMAEIAGQPTDERVQERAARLYHTNPVMRALYFKI